MTDYPGPEGVLIPRDLPATDVRIVRTVAAMRDLIDPTTPPPELGADGRSDQTFVLHVEAAGGTATAWGRDIYATTADLVVAALPKVINSSDVKGVLPFASMVAAAGFLQDMRSAQFSVTGPLADA
jgi:hypothetical protein